MKQLPRFDLSDLNIRVKGYIMQKRIVLAYTISDDLGVVRRRYKTHVDPYSSCEYVCDVIKMELIRIWPLNSTWLRPFNRQANKKNKTKKGDMWLIPIPTMITFKNMHMK